MTIARVDGKVVALAGLWWPAMNYSQFRWPHPLGSYELEIPSVEFFDRLDATYQQTVDELRADDLIVPDQQYPLKAAGYPALHELPNHATAFLEALKLHLWEDLFAAFLPCPPDAGLFMINSIDAATVRPSTITVSGRGYHAGPALSSSESDVP